MAVVVFDPAYFVEQYPQFKGVLTDAQLQQAFDVACLMLDNTNQSPIPYDPEKGVVIRCTLLNLLVCHLATRALWQSGQAGTVSTATEGSVSVGFSLPTKTDGEYFKSTPCGQTFWQAVRPYLSGGRYYAIRHYHPWG